MAHAADPIRIRKRQPHPVLRWVLGVFVALFLLIGAIGFGVDTDAGHRFIVDRIGEVRPGSGLRIHIGRIDGSIWRHARIKDLRLYDTRGLFLEAPAIQLDWRPTRWFANRLHIDRLASDLVMLHRLPALKATGNEGPILPGYRIHIGALDLRLRLETGVAGVQRRLVRIVGQADTGRGRAVIGLKARSSAGDTLALALDAEPDRNLFGLNARLRSPDDGVVPGLFGARRTVALDVQGDGKWTGWRGRASLKIAGTPIADLALNEAKGHYALAGRITAGSLLAGKGQRLAAPIVAVVGAGRYEDRRVDGQISLASPAMRFSAKGVIDLAHGAFKRLALDLLLLKPAALFPNMTGQDIHLHATLDGAFRRAAFRYALASPRFAFDQTGFEIVHAAGAGHLGGSALMLPITLVAKRVTGVGDVAGGILANLSVTGTLKITTRLLSGEAMDLRSDKLNGKLALFVDLVTGRYDVDLSGGLQRYLIPGLGIVDVLTELKVLPGMNGLGTVVTGHGRAWVRRFDNAFLRSLAGGLPELDTELIRSPDGVLHFSNLRLNAPLIRIAGTGQRLRDGSVQFQGAGAQSIYGSFKLALEGMIDHPKIGLLLDHPLSALGLAAVKLDLDPIDGGFAMNTAGVSTLGAFTGTGAIRTPPNAPATIRVDALNVSGTTARGELRADQGVFAGRLDFGGGGLAGDLDFMPVGANQRIVVNATASDAILAGDADLAVRRGNIDADLLLDPADIKIEASVVGQGLRRGKISLARFAARTSLVGGKGTMRASVAGSRGRSFAFESEIAVAPDHYLVRGQGQVEGKAVALANPADLHREGDGWRLSPTVLNFDAGNATVSGRFGGGDNVLEASLQAMPLSLLDMLKPGLGLSGEATGRLVYAQAATAAAPTGRAELRIRGLTRAGLVLSSKPVDLGLAAILEGGSAAMRVVAQSGGEVIGRAQVRLAPLPGGGTLADRLLGAPLSAQLRYNGPVDTIWRLSGIETIDLSGPVAIGADVGGTLRDPLIRGSLVTAAARLESATTGTVIETIKARGRFDGSRLLIDQLNGTTRDNGSVSGHAAFDFAGAHGLGMDIALDAAHATLINRDDIGGTVTGPLIIRSDGRSGMITGSVKLDRSSYRFGKAVAATAVPHLNVTEVNRAADIDEVAPLMPWALDLKIDARNQLFVHGLGLDSEWRAKLAIKGTVDNPAISGRADLVRGNYEFAGRRFDLDRGIIRFAGTTPVDPALDITAAANLQGLNASIHVSGTGLQPQIEFTSVPALPEDELLSRLLFGTSIANLSAPEALQLAGAVEGLRNGGKGGLDPINAVRRVAGLDRLRIEPADVSTGQKTSIAAGKYIGRKTYVELVTDGQGYSASRVEFQVTRWLSLLATISTIGRQSASLRISKDY